MECERVMEAGVDVTCIAALNGDATLGTTVNDGDVTTLVAALRERAVGETNSGGVGEVDVEMTERLRLFSACCSAAGSGSVYV